MTKREEIQQRYTQLCTQLGDRTNKIRVLKREVVGFEAEVDALDAEYKALVEAEAKEAAEKAETEKADTEEKIVKAQEKRAKRGKIAAVRSEPQ